MVVRVLASVNAVVAEPMASFIVSVMTATCVLILALPMVREQSKVLVPTDVTMEQAQPQVKP
jgi:hypothetical protein